jgi:hypothetical protein
MTKTEASITSILEAMEWPVDEAAITPQALAPQLGLPFVVAAIGVANVLVGAYNKGKADCGG